MSPEVTGTERDAAIAFVLKFARALHTYGMPAHRLEEAMGLCAEKLGVPGQFFCTPTSIIFAFGRPEEQKGSFLRVEPGEVNLQKLSLLDEVIGGVLGGYVSPAMGSDRVDRIVSLPAPHPPWLRLLAAGLASASGARFFGGAWQEVWVAGVAGVLVGGLAELTPRRPRIARVFEPLAAAMATALVYVAAAFLPISPSVTMLGSLITLFPGLTLTTAMTELAVDHLVAGTARLMGAMVTFLTIGFGVAIGLKVAAVLTPIGPVLPMEPEEWTLVPALILAPLSFLVLFRAPWRDAVPILVAGAVAFLAARLGGHLLGAELGGALGAFVVGVGSTVHSRLRNRPMAITSVPGLMLLVPGSIGFRSITALLAHDVVGGMQTAFRMILVATSLVAGLLLANLILRPRRLV